MKIYILLVIILCINNISNCPDKDEKCGSCNHATCDYCYDSYLGTNGQCVDSTIKIENCLTYVKNAKCRQCVFGFHLVENQCKKIEIENCIRVNTDNMCIVCKNKAFLVDGKCVSGKCDLKNCRHCNSENGVEICVFCDNGYSIYPVNKDLQCKKTEIHGCLALNFYDESLCSLCKAHFYYSNGDCKRTESYHINMEKSSVFSCLFMIFSFFIFFN